MQSFLDAGIAIEERDEQGQTALMVAVGHHQVEAVKLLLEHGADVNAFAASGWTALMSAAMLGNETLLTLLLANGAFVDADSLTKQTGLRVAAIFGHNACVRLLIVKGATLDPVEDLLRYTTLMFACTKCSPAIVELLIEQGADVAAMALDRMTPLRCAQAADRKDLVALLRKHGARV